MPRRTNLDLDLVRAFLVVCEQRSFTRAGERLGRSQSAVSLQVRRLEEQLGQPLLSRDPRHVAPTEQGAAFLPQARRLLRLNDEILASLGADEIEGEVRLGAPEDFATQHLPAVLGSFARSHPRIALTVTCDLTLNLLDRLSEGALDLALVKREPLGPDLCVRVWREPLIWVALDPELARRDGPIPLVAAPAPCVIVSARSPRSKRQDAPGGRPTPARPWPDSWRRCAEVWASASCRAKWPPTISPSCPRACRACRTPRSRS